MGDESIHIMEEVKSLLSCHSQPLYIKNLSGNAGPIKRFNWMPCIWKLLILKYGLINRLRKKDQRNKDWLGKWYRNIKSILKRDHFSQWNVSRVWGGGDRRLGSWFLHGTLGEISLWFDIFFYFLNWWCSFLSCFPFFPKSWLLFLLFSHFTISLIPTSLFLHVNDRRNNFVIKDCMYNQSVSLVIIYSINHFILQSYNKFDLSS